MDSGGQSTASAPGIRVLVEPAEQDLGSPNKNDDGIDIVAIHGIGADPDKTWTGRGPAGERVSWLSDSEMLPKAVPTARIMRFGYESAWYGTGLDEPKKTHVFDVAEMLLKQLELHRQALRRSFDNPDKWRHLFRFTAGAIFFGTPFRGRRGLTLVQIVEAVAQHNPDLQIYPETMALSVEENPYLQNIVYQFTETRRGDHPIPLWCFYETKPSPIGKTLLNSAIKDGYLIPAESACLDPSKSIERHPLERHHYNLQKFSGPSDPGYLVAMKAIVDLATRAPNYLRECCIDRTQKSCYHIELAKNNQFTGRNSILKAIEQKFFGKDQSQRIALAGLGGVGKTQIALHFVYQLKEKRPDYSIFWVPLLGHESVERAYREIAKKLRLQKSSDNEDIKDLVYQYLSLCKADKWLFILDNADDQELMFGSAHKPGLEEYLPKNENGIILLTTRSRQVAVEFARADVIDIEQMNQEEAANLFKKSLVQDQLPLDEALVTELLTYLTFLPLAITQAAAYLNVTMAPIQTYLGLLRGAEKDVTRLLGREFKDSTRYRGSRNAVGTTWLVTFDQIEKSDQAAVRLLSFISCIEPKSIPRSMLLNMEPEEMEWAVGMLCSYSFLVRRGDSSMFDMHSLVHMATREWVKRQGRREQVVNDAICHLARIFPTNNRADHELRREYLPHVTRSLYQNDGQRTDDAYYLFGKVGDCFYNDRRFKEATKCYEAVCRWKQDHLSKDDHNRLVSEHKLASAYLSDRRIKDAIEIFEHVVVVQKETLDEKDHFRLVLEHELARAYLDDRRIKDAIEIFERVVAVRKETRDEKDHSRLASENALACAYLNDGRIKDAIEIFERVVAVKKETLDEKDHDRLASEHELARAYLSDRRIKDAIEIFERVVAVKKETLDEEDYDRLASEHGLACAYLDDGRIKDAIEIFERVVAVMKETLDEKDHSRLTSERKLARAYLDDGRTKDAIEILGRIVTLEGEILSHDDPRRLLSHGLLTEAYGRMQLLDETTYKA
ncbi:tetratricopeptide repeat and NB-ARC domain protein [Metarhizium robertsii]|uniref:Tetratricopeptide repeat and NB-ARC domain protein n=1 Tax=Metarhizium robertsii TaxID=568076 RepID=A0A0A1UQP1_9HYPO|nr:tetratricopeptide repeat and NB-ARC domain protein [Metarhizium robertsii]